MGKTKASLKKGRSMDLAVLITHLFLWCLSGHSGAGHDNHNTISIFCLSQGKLSGVTLHLHLEVWLSLESQPATILMYLHLIHWLIQGSRPSLASYLFLSNCSVYRIVPPLKRYLQLLLGNNEQRCTPATSSWEGLV